jgi:autotransporter adhesin
MTTGVNNVAVGYAAQLALTTSFDNVGIGHFAQSALTTGTNNVAVGRSAQLALTTGSNNMAIGYFAGSSPAGVAANATVVGGSTVSIGNLSGASDATDPTEFVCVGQAATAGQRSVAVGREAKASGTTSVALGGNATASHTNSVALGADTTTTANSQVYIGARTLFTTLGVTVSKAGGTMAEFTNPTNSTTQEIILSDTTSSGKITHTGGTVSIFGLDETNVGKSGAKVGFYETTPVVKAAAPTTLADVITILTNVGLCA